MMSQDLNAEVCVSRVSLLRRGKHLGNNHGKHPDPPHPVFPGNSGIRGNIHADYSGLWGRAASITPASRVFESCVAVFQVSMCRDQAV